MLNCLKSSVVVSTSFRTVLNSRYNSTSTMSKIAVCQLTATEDKAKNLETVKKLVAKAALYEAKIAFLPEACDFIAAKKAQTRELAETLEGTTMSEYKTLAQTHKIWLSIGGFHELQEKSESPIYNAHVLIDDTGEIRSVYRKLHLFDVSMPEKNIRLLESEIVEKGKEILEPVDTPAGPMALSICYDLRFPELSTLQRKSGAAILTFPSAFTSTTGHDHWEVLLRARAIENQCYVVAAAQYGRHNEKRISYGHSMVVDPWGRVLAECPIYNPSEPTNESLVLADIDLKLVNNIRNEMPVFDHRRSDIYELRKLVKKSSLVDEDQEFKFGDKAIPPSQVFYRTQHCIALVNIRCVVPGHVLVLPIRRTKRLQDLLPEERSELFQTVVEVQKVIEKAFNATSSTVCIQDGKEAGQTIEHVHVHILPRKENDFENNDDIYSELAKHDKNGSTVPLRTISEMCAEANSLRKYF